MHLTLERLVRLREFLGFCALLVLAFFAWLGTGVAHAALAVMILLLLADGRAAWNLLSKDPAARIFALFLAYLLYGAFRAAQRWPETADAQWAAVWPWISLWLWIPVAWWLKGRWERIWTVMVLAPLGLLIGILRRSHWADLPLWLNGERYEFGYTALGVSLLSLVIVIGLLCFFPRIRLLGGTQLSRAGAVVAVGLLLSFFLFVLLVAQSRGVWLTLLFAIGLIAALATLLRRRHSQAPPNRAFGLAAAAMLAAGALLAAVTPFGVHIAERLRSEAQIIPQLLSAHEDQLPYSPWGARIHLSLWGLRLIAEHPWLGWGPGANAPRHLLKLEFGEAESGFLTVIEHFAHLHNAYVEILMRFGILGAGFFGCALLFLLKNARIQRRAGVVPTDFYEFGIVVLLSILFFGFYEFRLLHTDFRFLAMLLGGIYYTFALYPATEGTAPDSSRELGDSR